MKSCLLLFIGTLFLCRVSGHLYSERTGSLYRFHRECSPYAEARQICQEEGGDLVVINSEEEADELQKLFQSNPDHLMRGCTEYRSEAFIGVHYDEGYGDFRTIEGETLQEAGYVNWSKGEPNNLTEHKSSGEQCVTIFRTKELNDLYCGKNRAFICEISGYVYKKETDSLYKLHQDKAKWSDASAACEREGGHLAVVSSAEEAELIGHLLRAASHQTDTHVHLALVGFRYDSVRGKYLNLQGEEVKNVHEEADKKELEEGRFARPDSVSPVNRCGAVHRVRGLTGVDCGRKHVYLCEIERHLHQFTDIGESPAVPRATTGIPRGTTAIPRTTTAIPRATTAMPRATTNIQRETNGIPQATTDIPRATTAIPRTTTAIPRTTTAVPRTTTAMPRATTNIPRETNGIPRATTDIPRATTAIPQATTAIPRAMTNIVDDEYEYINIY